MFDHAEGLDGTGAAQGAVRAAVGRGGAAPDGWPGGVPGGAVVRGVWAALCTADSPVTARHVANAVGTRRESANRALCRLERAGWARRERGDGKAGVPDVWSPVAEWCAALEPGVKSSTPVAPDRADGPLSVPADCLTARRARMSAAGSTPPAAPGRRGDAAPPRLAAGELEEQVREVLRSRPGQEFGPLQLARMLGGRSQGAVGNACKRLVAKGHVFCSCEAPLRFTAAEQLL